MELSRYAVPALTELANALFVAAGLEHEKAATLARLLASGEMLGRTTHGLALCAPYIEQMDKGLMAKKGAPETIKDTGATFVWDGGYLPGLWLVDEALKLSSERVARHGVVTGVIRRSHHIACLAALVKEVTDRGYMAILASSGPAHGSVSPFGGREKLLTPNPIANGYPGSKQPVWVDISSSITTVGMAKKKAAAGERFDHPCLLDENGVPTTDPRVLTEPGSSGSLLLLGGMESGHKGFGLALMVEALTQGLAGFGRQDSQDRWGACVFLQVLDPAAFAGRDAFLRQMDYLTDCCHANAPIDEARPVRMPGEQAQRRVQEALTKGLALPASTVNQLTSVARRFGIAMPAAR